MLRCNNAADMQHKSRAHGCARTKTSCTRGDNALLHACAGGMCNETRADDVNMLSAIISYCITIRSHAVACSAARVCCRTQI